MPPARRTSAAALVLLALLGTPACSDGDDDAGAPTTPADGTDWWTDAQDAYLDFATTELSEGSALNVLAHIERSRRDPSFPLDLSTVTADDFAEDFERIDTWQDTTDFTLLYHLNLLYGGGDDVPPDVAAAMDERLTTFSYWYTEPRPEGQVDNKWYWSENHRIIFHTIELLAGNRLPDATFQDGRTGAEHATVARDRILEWLDEHAAYGFSEWHSDVYYQKDVTPLLTLVEHSGDPEIARRAEVMLDLVLLDIAVHLQKGNFGASHGRSYMKDKPTAWTQDTFGLSKLLFDDTSLPYDSTGDAGAVLLARAGRYRMPDAVRAVARHDEPMVDRTGMGVPLDPDAPWEADPEAPGGYAFDDPENLAFWWERGALTAWQVAPLTLQQMDEWDLWDGELFQDYTAFRPLASLPAEQVEQLADDLSPQIAFGVLRNVDSYTWRGRDAMLSTAQDHRPGMRGSQYHAWQATLDEGAVVFTTHPGNEPREGDAWVDGDMYWTGTASMPRSAQQGTAAIHIYRPAYERPNPGDLLESFDYLEATHAWFPTERFDEVRQRDGWTFGRKGDGYVALWSWRPTEWRSHDPAVVPTGGLTEDFDLVAPGGAENAWIVQVGQAGDGQGGFADFDAFVESVAGSPVDVTETDDGLVVTWTSPQEGEMRLGWTGPFRVGGDEVTLHDYPRMQNELVTVDGSAWTVRAGDATLTLDTETWTRRVD